MKQICGRFSRGLSRDYVGLPGESKKFKSLPPKFGSQTTWDLHLAEPGNFVENTKWFQIGLDSNWHL